jgi:PAS domain S-box-containing protein
MTLILTVLISAAVLLSPLPLQYEVGFAIPIFLCAWTRSRRLLWALAIFAVALTVLKTVRIGATPDVGNVFDFHFDRLILILTLLVCAGVSHMMIGLIESLETEQRRLVRVLDTVPVGVTIANTRDRTIIYNASAAQMLGVEQNRRYDMTTMVDRFAAAESNPQHDRASHGIVRAMSGEIVSGLEREFTFPDGRKLVVLVSAAPLHDRAGKIIGAVAGFVDITQQKQMQAELEMRRVEAEDASTRKSRFLAAVSHDIRTPANAISLLAELMERTSTGANFSKDAPELARDLKSSALSLVRLVSDVLDITRFDTARVDLNQVEFPLADMVSEECRTFGQMARDKGLEFTCDPPPASIIVRADRVKLGRILQNLMGNAVKFTHQGSVNVNGACTTEGEVQIRVTDTGPGIDPQHQQQIFDEYFQLKHVQRDSEKGTGLGLAICQRLAHAMSARIDVESAPGKGATFMLTLPKSMVVRC